MRFILMRRWKEDISNLWIEQYFSDVDVYKLTKGKYNCITVYRKVIYFGNFNSDTNKVEKGEKIGYAVALSTEQHYSGGSFLDVDTIIFEEFMDRRQYLKNEPELLSIFYSTIDRKRGVTTVWMVGNTISRICPYLSDWNLLNIIKQQKQGDINEVVIHNEENDVKIAIEYCKSSGGKTMAIGNAKNMVDSGSWQSSPQPKLEKSKKCYDILYRIVFQFQGFKFLAELLQDKMTKEICWFIFPKYSEIKDKTIVISDIIKQSPYYFRDIDHINLKNDKLRKILDTFRESKIFYSDDLCGTDFKQAIDFMIKK